MYLELAVVRNVSLYHGCYGKQAAVFGRGIEARCLMSSQVALQNRTCCDSGVRTADFESFGSKRTGQKSSKYAENSIQTPATCLKNLRTTAKRQDLKRKDTHPTGGDSGVGKL